MANMLAERHNVVVAAGPDSDLVPMLSPEVGVTGAAAPQADITICDTLVDPRTVEAMLRHGGILVPTLHGLPEHNPAFAASASILRLSRYTHFVAAFQARAHATLSPPRPFVIGNAVPPVPKHRWTGAAGSVGNLAWEGKNLPAILEGFARSRAPRLHLWGGVPPLPVLPKVKAHGWADSKARIFESFDVLLMPSLSETFGLVVAEAMSAGISCVISDIPAFEPFRGCPGVWQVDPHDPAAIAAALDAALASGPAVRAELRNFWRERFSPEVVARRWDAAIAGILAGHDPDGWSDTPLGQLGAITASAPAIAAERAP